MQIKVNETFSHESGCFIIGRTYKVDDALEGVAYGAAFVATGFRLAKAEVELLGSGGAWAVFGMIEAFDGLAKAAAYVSEHVFGHHIDTSGIDAAADHMK